MSHHDVIVIGAGPAGLAASACLAEMGLNVLALDEQNRLGGQIYRNMEATPQHRREMLGEDYTQGLPLAKRFRQSGAAYENGATVWQVEPDGTVCYSRQGQSAQIMANYIIVATGAMERPMPIPGWTLPGVMGAGAANNLFKEAGLNPTGRLVLAGSGPLLLLEASLLAKKGVAVGALLETTPAIPPAPAIPRAPKALMRTDFLWKGVSMLREIRKAGIRPLQRGHPRPRHRPGSPRSRRSHPRRQGVASGCRYAAAAFRRDPQHAHLSPDRLQDGLESRSALLAPEVR